MRFYQLWEKILNEAKAPDLIHQWMQQMFQIEDKTKLINYGKQFINKILFHINNRFNSILMYLGKIKERVEESDKIDEDFSKFINKLSNELDYYLDNYVKNYRNGYLLTYVPNSQQMEDNFKIYEEIINRLSGLLITADMVIDNILFAIEQSDYPNDIRIKTLTNYMKQVLNDLHYSRQMCLDTIKTLPLHKN